MSFVRTVLGDIPPTQLGVCYAHEHIIIDPGFATAQTPEFLLDSVDIAVAELTDFYTAGGRAMIDAMPADSGRNAVKLAETSRRSQVHIVCPTGLHLSKYYLPRHWSQQLSAHQLADLFIADIQHGVDIYDYSGPIIERSAHKAGVIKIAGGKDALSPHEQKVFIAAAIAHRKTGCPILTHTEEGTAALAQIDILREHGTDPGHVVLSHTDRLPDLDYHRRLLRTGVRLEYDSGFRWKPDQPNHTLNLLRILLPEFPDQIMLGMDAARRTYWKHYGGKPGLTFLLTEFIPQLRSAGISQDLIDRIFVHTPASAYAFIMPGTPVL